MKYNGCQSHALIFLGFIWFYITALTLDVFRLFFMLLTLLMVYWRPHAHWGHWLTQVVPKQGGQATENHQKCQKPKKPSERHPKSRLLSKSI
jgi:hypothetical protein